MNESRKDKSLYTLTKKFVEMLKTEETVDLNIVTHELNCAKKRRIYDVSNVLEGIGLIKKTQKNLYQYTGRTYKDESSSLDHGRLQRLTEEKESLERIEKELDKDIKHMGMNFTALGTQDSFVYLTKNDFLDAFGSDNSILVLQDCRTARVIFDYENSNVPIIQVCGYIVKPVTIKLVNTETPDKIENTKFDENILHLNMNQIKEENDENDITNDPAVFDSSKKMKKSDCMILFRRSFRSKTFMDSDQKENEILSKNVLDYDRYDGKSKFFYVKKNQLVHDSDYEKPDFIEIEHSVDVDYEKNYSTDPPSIHDLFDLTVEPIVDHQNSEDFQDMIEEEYIIEALDEESYEMLQ